MKRIALLTVLLLVLGLASGFAADGTPVAVTGTLSFGFGIPDFDADQPSLPQFDAYESTSATAKISLSLADDAITAGININLLALPTLTLTNGFVYPDLYPADVIVQTGFTVNNWAQPYQAWLALSGIVGFWNDHYEDVIGDGTTSIWTAADLTTAYATLSNYDAATHLGVMDADTAESEIVLFDFASADFGNAILAADIAAEAGAFAGAVSAAVDQAIVNILAGASAAVVAAVTDQTSLNSYLTAVTATEIAAWGAGDRDLLAQAADLYIAFRDGVANGTYPSKNSLAAKAAFLSGANVTFKKVAGVLDISYLFGGQHAAAGSLNADGSGHQSDAVDAYSGLSLALAADVVPNVTAGLTFYATKPSASVSDSWYTVLVDETADVANPVYGLAVNGGLSMAIMEGVTAGADLGLGLYDLLGGAPAWAFSLKPSFSGFGATLGGEFAYGLGGVMLASADVSYSIMGITVSPFFKYAAVTADYVVAYADPITSIDASVLNGGGMEFGANLSVDISKLVAAVPVTLTGGVTSGADSLEWKAGLSATVAGITLAANANSTPLLVADNLDYDASLSFAYDKATIKAAFTNAYSDSLDRYVMGFGVTCKVSF